MSAKKPPTVASQSGSNLSFLRWLLFIALIVQFVATFVLANIFLAIGLVITTGFCFRRQIQWQWNPLTLKRIKRFKQIYRGSWSFYVLISFWFLSLFAELIVSNRALVVYHENHWYFPTYSKVHLGTEFGYTEVEQFIPTDYRHLQKKFRTEAHGDFVLMPIIPFSPNENNTFEGVLKARPPSWTDQHYLGTDETGRDILARLIYGFRITVFFALFFTLFTYLIGVTLGCIMGYMGGFFDLFFQRLIEIWSNIPFLYTVLIVFSIIPSALDAYVKVVVLLVIMVLFSWTHLTYYMRTETLRERARDYSAAAIVLGASPFRVVFHHILPNTISTLVTFAPFTISSAIAAITALDFLGYGLPAPTPSIGELLKQGRANITTAPWIVISAFLSLTVLLTLVTFVGEAVREAFDPKKFTKYL